MKLHCILVKNFPQTNSKSCYNFMAAISCIYTKAVNFQYICDKIKINIRHQAFGHHGVIPIYLW